MFSWFSQFITSFFFTLFPLGLALWFEVIIGAMLLLAVWRIVA